MKIGLIGLPQTGKTTLFQILTGSGKPVSGTGKTTAGTGDVLDSRFDNLVSMYEPQSSVRARIEVVLLPRMERENIAGGGIFRDIAEMDAICHVVRAFHDDSIYHEEGSVDPIRDIDMVNTELILHDLMFVEKRIERIQAMLKKVRDDSGQKELDLLKRMKSWLEQEHPLRLLGISKEETALIKSYPFITRKKMILALNIGENDLGSDNLLSELSGRCKSLDMEVMQVSAQVESEISMFDDDDEKKEFLKELGIMEPALETLTGLCLKALGLISFFTVGTDEVRQWLVRKNSTAPEAAGVIHSDLKRGFIRAEVMSYEDLTDLKSEAAMKKAGKMHLHGKDYVVRDGDILNIRFKV